MTWLEQKYMKKNTIVGLSHKLARLDFGAALLSFPRKMQITSSTMFTFLHSLSLHKCCINSLSMVKRFFVNYLCFLICAKNFTTWKGNKHDICLIQILWFLNNILLYLKANSPRCSSVESGHSTISPVRRETRILKKDNLRKKERNYKKRKNVFQASKKVLSQ